MASAMLAGTKRSFGTMAMEGDQQQQHSRTSNPISNAARSRLQRQKLREFVSAPGDEVLGIGLTSTSSSPVPPHVDFFSRKFPPDASVVLTGIRGTGKSTLAVIASTAMKRKVIDAEKEFQKGTGMSSLVYKKTHGAVEYQHRQTEVWRDIIHRHRWNTIIVCSWMERNVQGLLRELGETNPVIYVVRDAQAIQQHLEILDDGKVRHLLDATGSVIRKCTLFEFFNVSEAIPKSPVVSDHDGTWANLNTAQKSAAPYLALKRTERHFLKFLSLILPQGTIPFIESAYPLALVTTEDRDFTYATSITLSELLGHEVDIESLETGADAIEIIVDDLVVSKGAVPVPWELSPQRASDVSKAIGQIRRNTVIPIILHVLLPDQQGSGDTSSPFMYLQYIHHGLRLAPEYISVDLRVDDDELSHIVTARGKTKIIGHFHWAGPNPLSWSDPFWTSHYRRAQKLGCSLVRLTRGASHYAENFEVSRLRAAVEGSGSGSPILPLIAYNTGYRGKNSACLNQVLTPVLPRAQDNNHLDGEARQFSFPRPALTALQATRALYSSFVYEPMKLFVFGGDVNHSLSPAMHNAALRALGIPHHYAPHSTSSIREIQEIVTDSYFAGASVGQPFKVEVISLTDSLSRHAKAIGAVNTIIPVRDVGEDGSASEDAMLRCKNRPGPVRALYGENTDWVGMRACIRRGLSPANAVRPSSCGLVIGAGGMARAAVYALLQLGVKNIAIFNRTYANAKKLVQHFATLRDRDELPLLSEDLETPTRFNIIRSRDEPWPEGLRYPTMIVSCIPAHSIGGNDNPGESFTLPASWLSSPTGGVVVELPYKTLSTPLLDQSRREAHRGWVTMDGLDLLPEQGFAQFELFTGRRAPRRLMKREVIRAYPDENGRNRGRSVEDEL